MTDYVKLSVEDKHHWKTNQEITAWLCGQIAKDAMVLEVGAARQVFPKTTHVVDCDEKIKLPPNLDLVICDVTKERLPFPDKMFDFCYCRHVIEDLYDPALVLSEMSRVSKAGYIETPSPMAELCRGVDGPKYDGQSPDYRGYHHHHWIVWEHEGELKYFTKFPLIEHLFLDDATLVGILKTSAAHWNTSYLWDGEIRSRHIQETVDYTIIEGYMKLLKDSLTEAVYSINGFWEQKVIKPKQAA